MRFAFTILTTVFASLLANASDLTVYLKGARSDEGTLLVSIYDRADSFPRTAMRTEKAIIQNGQGMLIFKDLKPGTYAIAVAHDANNNGELDKNGFGIPVEGYGFSRQASAPFGPPKFEAACFPVGKLKTATNIELKYF